MTTRLISAIAILLLASCNKNTDDRPVCLIDGSYAYSMYGGYNTGIFPNAFTPNGDGKNDRFKPAYASATGTFTLTVSDKNNNILFQTHDPNTIGWDGTNSAGEAAPAGRYAVKVESSDGYQQATNLCVALLRYGSSGCIPASNDGSYYFEDMYSPNSQSFNRITREVICPQ